MVSLSDRIRILLGMKVFTKDKTEPVASRPAEPQEAVPVDNKAYCGILRGASAPQAGEIKAEGAKTGEAGAEAATVQAPELKPAAELEHGGTDELAPVPSHAGELERLRHYAELAKQNRLDNDALNEDLD